MSSKMLYNYIGLDNKRYICQLRQITEIDGNKVYHFLDEHSGDTLLIKKVNGEWTYHDCPYYYLKEWARELGDQIDSEEFQ